MIIGDVKGRGRLTTLASLAGALLVVVAACETPAPTTAGAPVVGEAIGDIRLSALGPGEPIVFVGDEEVELSALDEIERASVESIEVIKGPAAIRLYGERAASGVIRIEMKPE